MKLPSIRPSLPKLAVLCTALVLLGACATAPDPTMVGVAPTPRVGPGPITAYDAYAFVLFSPQTEKGKAIAMVPAGSSR